MNIMEFIANPSDENFIKSINLNCLVPILNSNSTKLIKNACLFYDKITPLYRTSRWLIRRELFPVKFLDTNNTNMGERTALELETESELEWLHENGILDSPDEVPYSELDDFYGYNAMRPIWSYRTKKGGQRWQNIDETFNSNIIQRVGLPIYCDQLNVASPSSTDKKQQIIEILLNHFPVLPEDTPWEDILEWRNNKDAIVKLRRLKHWVNTVSQRNVLNLKDLEDEIIYLLDEYEQYMKIKKIKYTYSPVRTLLTTTGELFENIAKLKIKNLMDLPFQISERSILISESELFAPGRELAYIVEAKEQFKNI